MSDSSLENRLVDVFTQIAKDILKVIVVLLMVLVVH